MLAIELRFWDTSFSTNTSRGVGVATVVKLVPGTVIWYRRVVLCATAVRVTRTLKYTSLRAPGAIDAIVTVLGASTVMFALVVVNANAALTLVAATSPVLVIRTPTGNAFGP